MSSTALKYFCLEVIAQLEEKGILFYVETNGHPASFLAYTVAIDVTFV